MRRPQAVGWVYFIKPVYGLKSAQTAENPAHRVSPWPEVNAAGLSCWIERPSGRVNLPLKNYQSRLTQPRD
ncbi:MAG: hypothetical protein EBT62_08975 [Opitutaceae bacterium]|nr:hypothetical protein [Opitutaceae bacterium]